MLFGTGTELLTWSSNCKGKTFVCTINYLGFTLQEKRYYWLTFVVTQVFSTKSIQVLHFYWTSCGLYYKYKIGSRVLSITTLNWLRQNYLLF